MSTLIEEQIQQVGDANPASRVQETWAASRAREQEDEKELMARDFADHDFLVRPAGSPDDSRESVASILVNQGTSPNVVVRVALEWIEQHASANQVFHITWYSPGALVPATLHEFRQRNPHLSAATHVHLFPGEVDLQLQAMISKEAQDYARNIQRRFSYMLLSGHSFDFDTGVVRFQFDREIPIQKTSALLKATRKFLFFDSRKFTGEGEVGYSLADLLGTSRAVSIYTVSSDNDQKITDAFKLLAGTLLPDTSTTNSDYSSMHIKTLNLKIIGKGQVPTTTVSHKGFLTPPAK